MINSEQPLPEPERSELCWELSQLLDRLLTTPAPLPPRLRGMHTHVLLYGGIYWRRRQQAEDGTVAERSQARATHLFGRAAHRLDPVPPWLIQTCTDLGITPIADPAPRGDAGASASADRQTAQRDDHPTGGDAPLEESPAAIPVAVAVTPMAMAGPPSPLWPPTQLVAEVEQWLLEGGAGRPRRVGLVCVPGAAMLCREGTRLAFNVAALLEDPAASSPDPWLEALCDPLRRALDAGWLPQIELAEPFSGIYDSLSHHWRLGGLLPMRQLERLPAVLNAWQRLLGPGRLAAQRLPCALSGAAPPRSDGHGGLQVHLDPLELAVLMACDPSRHASADESRAEIEAVLARLRREHLNANFWQAPAADQPAVETLALEALRLLHRDAGFYASSGAGPDCLASWREGVLGCLERAQIWIPGPGGRGPALLHLAQLLTQRAGRLPDLQPRPSLLTLLERLAGLEVLYVGWDVEPVLEQHRSGRAFRLFSDRGIVPYGLRAVAMPDSRHPRRPNGGFSDSLARLAKAVEEAHAARPIQLLLVDQGAYRLPLLDRIERCHGIPAVAPGPALLQLFGIDRGDQARWREEQRNPEAWRTTCGTIGAELAQFT